MKLEEKIASDFLKTRFYKEPMFEPLGRGTAPDFSIDATAFEVRRLNQRCIQNGVAEGLEEVSLPLEGSVHSQTRAPLFGGKCQKLSTAGYLFLAKLTKVVSVTRAPRSTKQRNREHKAHQLSQLKVDCLHRAGIGGLSFKFFRSQAVRCFCGEKAKTQHWRISFSAITR